MKKILSFTLALAVTFMMNACGGGGGSGTSSTATATTASATTTTTGVVYPVISGLNYQTDSSSGVVASDGSYSYKPNEGVTFSIGGVVIGTAPTAAQVTPLNLADDVSSKNLLRILLALDTDNNLSNGVSLPAITAASSPVSLDLTVELSVVAALTSLLPAATLPAASNAQVTAAQAKAKTTSLGSMGTYGPQYKTIQTDIACSNPTDPKNAVVDFTSQPNWATGAMTGTATLTLKDNSTVSVPFTTSLTKYMAGTTNYNLMLGPSYKAKSRIVFLSVNSPSTTYPTGVCLLALRDTSPSNANMKPVVMVAPYTESGNQCVVTTTGVITCGMDNVYYSISAIAERYGYKNSNTPGTQVVGDQDFDGFEVAWEWKSSKGTTGTGRTFSETCNVDSLGHAAVPVYATLTVTDDEGATGTKTFQLCGTPGATATAGATSSLVGKWKWMTSKSGTQTATDLSTWGVFLTITGTSFVVDYPASAGTAACKNTATLTSTATTMTITKTGTTCTNSWSGTSTANYTISGTTMTITDSTTTNTFLKQ